MKVSLNQQQQLYVIPSGQGYSCYGFDNCFQATVQLCAKLRKPAPLPALKGTLDLYQQYQDLIGQFSKSQASQTTWFDPGTPIEVQTILENARVRNQRLRIFLGDRVTGTSWLEEHDVVGYIGRSMGPMRVPLLLKKNADGGGAILTASIVKIVNTATKQALYAHPKFNLPEFTLETSLEFRDLPFIIKVGGEVHARFKTSAKRDKWVKFMRGEAFTK